MIIPFRHARTLALTLATLACVSFSPARAESVLRVAMTAGDIPDWSGMTDQGAEGVRFVGNSLYEALIGWDLSRSDVEAQIRPVLATEWHIDPDDHKRWIFSLRQGVKFHDGCDWNADSAVWNFDRYMNNKAAAYNALQ
ncbi:MAG TPA: ABC transporter substrate-binding protein, partial [Beijerinckiaceae bacterium]|nr:ABC transporter substrate-binding protein [Beijerinckiaceae bacterium]